MTDDEIRQLIRSAIARHLGPGASPAAAMPLPPAAPLSFHRYPIARAADDVMCIIEPAVRCNHCGYCECHGH